MSRKLASSFLLLVVTACSPADKAPNASTAAATAADSVARDSAAHQAHANYVEAINSNIVDSLMDMMTEDVVFLAANDKPIIGKAAVRAWADEYVSAFHTQWDKPVQEFVISGDYAFERYNYTSTDTPISGGAPLVDTGWGLVVYHREADGVWRVARDAFGPDHAPAAK